MTLGFFSVLWDIEVLELVWSSFLDYKIEMTRVVYEGQMDSLVCSEKGREEIFCEYY